MKNRMSAVFRCVYVCFLLCSLATLVQPQNLQTAGQTSIQFPTRFRIQDRTPDLVISEDLARGRSPFHSVVTGDFNGDQIHDLLVINSLADGSTPGTGRASVIFGRSSLGASGGISLASDQPDLAIFGPRQFSQLGYAAAAGDLNGDGIDDIVLAATGTKAIYVIFGSRAFPNRTVDLNRIQADVVVLAKGSENFSSGLAVGDINGDGFSDLIFGRQAAGPANASILLGPFFPGTTVTLESTEADIIIRGKANLDGFGHAIAVGDVNSDGISDLVIGSPGAARDQGLDAGAVYILKGSPNLEQGLSMSVTEAQPLLTVLAAFGGVDFGFGDGLGRVIAVSDVNADGIADLVLGVPNSTRVGNGPGPTSAGETYVIFGSPALGGVVDIRKNEQDLTIQGRTASDGNRTELGDLLGQSIAIGDMDGDGVSDIILGAPGAAGTKDRGETYVVLGSTELTSSTLIKVSEDDHDLGVFGQQSGGLLGSVVGSADINNDGISDLILEAPNADSSGGNQQVTGAIYIYFGGKIRPPEIAVAKYKQGKSLLRMFGAELTGDLLIEINGIVIGREFTFFAEDGLITMKGTKQELNLNSSPNQIVLVRKGTRSNSVKVKGT